MADVLDERRAAIGLEDGDRGEEELSNAPSRCGRVWASEEVGQHGAAVNSKPFQLPVSRNEWYRWV